MTARAVGRETADAALQGQVAPNSEAADGRVPSTGVVLRDLTRRNLEKVLQYRSEEDKERFRQLAAEWAVRFSFPHVRV